METNDLSAAIALLISFQRRKSVLQSCHRSTKRYAQRDLEKRVL